MSGSRMGGFLRSIIRQRFFAVLLMFVAIFIYFSLSQSRFFTSGNIDALLTGGSILWMVSMGLTFVMLAGGFDLSLGSLLALAGIAMGTFMTSWGVPFGLAVVLTMLFGLLLGALVNGVLIGKAQLPFLVVTLGTLTLYGGLVELWSKQETKEVPSNALTSLAFSHGFGVPVPAWIMIGVLIVALFLQRSTYFGRDIYAVGGSPEAARLAGVRVSRTLIIAYGIAGLMAGLAGVIQVARIGAASPQVGGNIIFDATAAVLLGGTSFSGGIGGVGGTAIGVLFLATLENGLSVAGVATYWQQIVTGAILVIVVGLDRIQNRQGRLLPRGLRRRGAPPGAGPAVETAPPPAAARPS